MARLPTLTEVEEYQRELRNARREDRVPRYRDPREVYNEDPNREGGFLVELTEDELADAEKARKKELRDSRKEEKSIQQAMVDNQEESPGTVLPHRVSGETDTEGNPVVEYDIPELTDDPNTTPKVEVFEPNQKVGTPEAHSVQPPVNEDQPGATEVVLTDDESASPTPAVDSGGSASTEGSELTQDIQPAPDNSSTSPTTPEQAQGDLNVSSDRNSPLFSSDSPSGLGSSVVDEDGTVSDPGKETSGDSSIMQQATNVDTPEKGSSKSK